MAKVVIGVDPHKRLNAVVVINAKGTVLARRQFDNSAEGFRELKVFWRQWRSRTWAIEGCNGDCAACAVSARQQPPEPWPAVLG